MDKPRANTAVAHKLARMVYFMLTRGEAFVDQRQQHYEEQQRQRSIDAPPAPRDCPGFPDHSDRAIGLKTDVILIVSQKIFRARYGNIRAQAIYGAPRLTQAIRRTLCLVGSAYSTRRQSVTCFITCHRPLSVLCPFASR
jgi:hypothetical protein